MAIDHGVAFGRPILLTEGVRVEDVVDLWLAGDDIRDVAREFGLAPHVVEALARGYAQAA